jgi:hypothetical protein
MTLMKLQKELLTILQQIVENCPQWVDQSVVNHACLIKRRSLIRIPLSPSLV